MTSRDAIMTLIGAILVKIGSGVITTWGSNNLYFLSYFYHYGTKVTPSTNSFIMLSIIIPACLVILISTKLSNYFGYTLMIRICSIVFLISPLLIMVSFNLVTLMIFCFFIPASAFAISSIPIINSLWGQFPNSMSKVSALIVIFFGLGGIIWNIMFMKMVNPNNRQTNITDNNMTLFQYEVVKGIKTTTSIIYLLAGLLFIIGAFLIRKLQTPQTQINQEIQLKESSPSQEDASLVTQNTQTLSLKSALKDRRFIIIVTISLFTSLYQIYVVTNLKIIYLPIINDDHFLGYCLVIHQITSLFGSLIWGILGDRKGFPYSMLFITAIDLAVKIYGTFAKSKLTLTILFLLLGVTDKGILTLVGPGLVQIFGISMATELLPFKGGSMFIGFGMVPIFQIVMSRFLSPHSMLMGLTLFSVVGFILSVLFYQQNKSEVKINDNNVGNNMGNEMMNIVG